MKLPFVTSYFSMLIFFTPTAGQPWSNEKHSDNNLHTVASAACQVNDGNGWNSWKWHSWTMRCLIKSKCNFAPQRSFQKHTDCIWHQKM